MNILDHYIKDAPRDEAAVALFEGEWSSRMPPPHENLTGGTASLFEDARVSWMIEELGGVDGLRILELGPLEGGHSYMLERAGAEGILSIEANSRAFLKCLIVKNLFGLTNTRFQYGDFMAYLREEKDEFDLSVASGVLYHMQNPLELLGRLSGFSKRMFLWTHYYDEETIGRSSHLRKKFSEAATQSFGSFSCTVHKQEYERALDWSGFCGGSAPFSYWMKRQDILDFLSHLGFSSIKTAFDQTGHPNGPAFCILAAR